MRSFSSWTLALGTGLPLIGGGGTVEYLTNISGGQAYHENLTNIDMWTGEENPHAIYVEKYDAASKVFYCINSWGRFIKSKPKVHISAVSRIYSISLELE